MPKRVRNTRNEQRSRYYAKHRVNSKNSNQAWTSAEERMVLDHKIPDVELSKNIGRSVEAIQIKRCRLTSSNDQMRRGAENLTEVKE